MRFHSVDYPGDISQSLYLLCINKAVTRNVGLKNLHKINARLFVRSNEFLFFVAILIFIRVEHDLQPFSWQNIVEIGQNGAQSRFLRLLLFSAAKESRPWDESWRLQPNRMAKATKHGPEKLLPRQYRLPVCYILYFFIKQSICFFKTRRNSVTIIQNLIERIGKKGKKMTKRLKLSNIVGNKKKKIYIYSQRSLEFSS